MNLRRLWCLLVIIAFSMPAFADVQIDSMDDINDVMGSGADPNWFAIPEVAAWRVVQAPPGEVNELPGSMKINYQFLIQSAQKEIEVVRTWPALALDINSTNYKDLAITLWVWHDDVNDSKLHKIILHDSSTDDHVDHLGYDQLGGFTVPHLKNVGWNKVIAPLRNFTWMEFTFYPLDPNAVLWNDVNQIGLLTNCIPKPGNAIYMDDLRLEVAPPPMAIPGQISSFDNIETEGWLDGRGTGRMRQDANVVYEPNGSMRLAFTEASGSSEELWDIEPRRYIIPAIDLTAREDWAITVWVWTEDVNDVNSDTKLHEIIIYDTIDHMGRYRVALPTSSGWNKATANLEEFFWNHFGSDDIILSPDEPIWHTIFEVGLWASSWPNIGSDTYIDDLRIEPAVETVSEAKIVNADYATIAVDGDASDWEDLDDSDVVDFDLASVPHQPKGDLHVKYRLAWDYTYLYILVQEQNEPGTGDLDPCEAPDLAAFEGERRDKKYDNLSLFFDFKNDFRQPGLGKHVNLWLFLGLSSTGRTDLMMAWTNHASGIYGGLDPDAIANGSVATSGTLGSRIIEAKIKWSDLDDHLYYWSLPEGGLAAAVKPGYIFGCDPRLTDTEFTNPQPPPPDQPSWTAEKGMAWINGTCWGWPDWFVTKGMPTGKDSDSIDVRLVCSAGDLDFDCDVDFVDYAQFAAEWDETDCNNLNVFCNGADIIIDGDVTLKDLARFTERWLDGF